MYSPSSLSTPAVLPPLLFSLVKTLKIEKLVKTRSYEDGDVREDLKILVGVPPVDVPVEDGAYSAAIRIRCVIFVLDPRVIL